MKSINKIFCSLIVLITLCSLMSCSNFQVNGADDCLSIVLPGKKSKAAFTKDDVTKWTITLQRINSSDTAKVKEGKPGETIRFDNVKPGKYKIMAAAFAGDKVAFTGEETATVVAGRKNYVSIRMRTPGSSGGSSQYLKDL